MALAGRCEGLESTIGSLVAHPIRSRCLTILADRTASPAELAREFGVKDVGKITYHVGLLEKWGAIELVRTRPVRGAVEHFYRAVKRPYVSDEEYENLPVKTRLEFARLILQFSVADIASSVEVGTFGKRHNHHVNRRPMQVDEQGWEDLVATAREADERAVEIEVESANRLAEDPTTKSIPVRVVAVTFEMPEADKLSKNISK